MIEYIWILLILYLFYKLIFDFILPISKATSQVKTKIKEMQKDQMNTSQKQNASSSFKSNGKMTKEEDYIDFEEIK